MKEGYKKTELGWIPEEWEVKRLEDITSVITKGTTPTTYGYDFVDKGINFIKIESINAINGTLLEDTFSKITEECHEKLSRSILEKNDILFAIAGATIGKSAMVSEENLPANTNQALAIIRINKNFNEKFIFQQIRSFVIQDKINNLKTNTAQPNLNLKQVGNFLFIIPPKEEQEKIAEILSTVDSQIDDTERIIEKTKELKKGLMQQLLTKGIGHSEFKKTEVGEIPVEWEVKKIGEVSDFVGSGVTPRGGQKVYSDSGIMFIRSQNILINKISDEDIVYISEEMNEKMKRTEVLSGDILLNITGASIGRCALVPNDFGRANVNQHVCIIRIKEGVGKFLVQYINSFFVQKQINSFNGGSSREGLNFEQVRKLQIPFPPLEEQEKIASILSSVDNEIDQYEKKKSNLEELKKGLMQKLLTGEIRVKY